MAIHDLLWACPLCGTLGGLRPARGGDACAGCGAVFRRARGASIQARLRDGRTVTKAAAEWADALPADPLAAGSPSSSSRASDTAGTGTAATDGSQGGVLRRDAVLARFAVGEEAIRLGHEYLGRMERLGEPVRGTLRLTDTVLELRLEDGETRSWALDDMSALQASSGTVQIRPRGEPIVSFEFPDSSARLWEESIAAALRHRWALMGRGEIVEFQPRIVGPRARRRPAGPGAGS